MKSIEQHLQGVAGTLALMLLLSAALFCFGCATSRPPGIERPASVFVPVTPAPTSIPVAKPVIPVAAPVKPAFFLSTAAGSARRQARKDARAAVPRSLGKGAVFAPVATEVVAAYKNRAPVVNADTGAVVTTIEKVKAPVAIGDGATATSTESKGISWWWLLVPAAGLALWLYRKTLPFA